MSCCICDDISLSVNRPSASTLVVVGIDVASEVKTMRAPCRTPMVSRGYDSLIHNEKGPHFPTQTSGALSEGMADLHVGFFSTRPQAASSRLRRRVVSLYAC